MFFDAAIHVVFVRFSVDEGNVRDLVRPEWNGAGGYEEFFVCVRRAAYGMLYPDDAGIVSQLNRGTC